MSKLILFLTFLVLTILLAGGLIAPNDPTMWLASSATGYMALRAILMVVIVALLITNPPRNKVFRAFVGFLATGLFVWAVTATYQNHMQFLDSASILAAAISMGIVALEFQPTVETTVDLKALRARKKQGFAK